MGEGLNRNPSPDSAYRNTCDALSHKGRGRNNERRTRGPLCSPVDCYALRFTSARNAFTGFSLAGTRLRNASSSGAVFAWKSFIIAGGICTTSMPPSVSRFRLSLSALSDSAQKSGSSFFASSSIAFCCAALSFFQVSLLTLTIWHDQVWLVG